MIKASHNTFSYTTPLRWWLRPFAFVGKCQSKTLWEQFRDGVRVFDLRVRKNKRGEYVIAHNAFEYVEDFTVIQTILEWLDGEADVSGERVFIRLLHEVRNKHQAKHSAQAHFAWFCEWAVREFPHLTFMGGQRVMDWQQDYEFPSYNNIEYIERHCSVCWPKYMHWCPWLFAKLKNKKIEKEFEGKRETVFMDFI